MIRMDKLLVLAVNWPCTLVRTVTLKKWLWSHIPM